MTAFGGGASRTVIAESAAPSLQVELSRSVDALSTALGFCHEIVSHIEGGPVAAGPLGYTNEESAPVSVTESLRRLQDELAHAGDLQKRLANLAASIGVLA